MASYLPPTPGLLPKWMLLAAIAALGNCIQSYTTVAYTRRLYAPTKAHSEPSSPNPEVTRLSGRTFGTWTFLSTIVRLYAAYNIEDRRFYELALWTYIIAFAHFFSEWAIFKNARLWSPWALPASIASGTAVWMLLVWDDYVK
ncbi:MAG: hypothetical protein Q9160_001419 [Pyrenula sp. 1 TL-2023]